PVENLLHFVLELRVCPEGAVTNDAHIDLLEVAVLTLRLSAALCRTWGQPMLIQAPPMPC
ncbi:MAG: hypothetical protein CVV16_10600, partial [Gammaproteobacteria bacterium HGW-Gammaproteobacteria-6]